jgi:hypothetical protein
MNDAELLAQALNVLRQISMIGGNLPDDRHQSRTGPNDAVQRGLMYTEARRQANTFLFENKQELAPNTYFQPTADQVRVRGHIGGITMADAKRALASSDITFKVDHEEIKVGGDVRVEVDLGDGLSVCVTLTHEGIIMDAFHSSSTESIGTSSQTYQEALECLVPPEELDNLAS